MDKTVGVRLRCYETDYGMSAVGPVFDAAFRSLDDGLAKSRRTKDGKEARRQLADIEQCLATLARLYWACGSEMTVTP